MSANYNWQGLEDGKHNVLECKECQRPLADIWVTKPHDISLNYMSVCPFCGGQSQIIAVAGLVHIGGVDKEVFGDVEQTRLSEISIKEIEGQTINLVKVRKE